MKYLNEIRQASADAQNLETVYQSARKAGEAGEFQQDLLTCREEAPENILYSAWFYRLEQSLQTSAPTQEKSASPDRGMIWRLALPFAFLSALAIGLLASKPETLLQDYLPVILFVWAPVAAAIAILFFVVAAARTPEAKNRLIMGIGMIVLMTAAVAFVVLIAPRLVQWYSENYLNQMAIHLPLLAWIAMGLTLLGLRSLVKDRFGFLIKSIEAVIVAGLYLIAGVVFGLITMGLLATLSIQLPEFWMFFLVGAGIGLIPIIALVTIYDPRLKPSEQDFNQGLSKFTATMLRLFLPLTLVVLVIYVLFIPFNFLEPFTNRDVLIVYNLMLFAVMALLLGATPMLSADLSPNMRDILRKGMIAAAVLAIVVSLYAFAAILYRTFDNGITINRLVIIGWNLVNTTILAFLAFHIYKGGKDGWIERAQAVFSRGSVAYVVWTLAVIFVVPLLFL